MTVQPAALSRPQFGEGSALYVPPGDYRGPTRRLRLRRGRVVRDRRGRRPHLHDDGVRAPTARPTTVQRHGDRGAAAHDGRATDLVVHLRLHHALGSRVGRHLLAEDRARRAREVVQPGALRVARDRGGSSPARRARGGRAQPARRGPGEDGRVLRRDATPEPRVQPDPGAGRCRDRGVGRPLRGLGRRARDPERAFPDRRRRHRLHPQRPRLAATRRRLPRVPRLLPVGLAGRTVRRVRRADRAGGERG